jgi:hypothetical protein
MADSYIKSDAVEVSALKLTDLSGQRTYDLRQQCTSISIYEDITFPVVRAELTIVDAIGLLTSFPIIGEELITLTFSQPGYNKVDNTYTLRIKSIENVKTAPSGKSKTYTIRAASSEFLTSSKQHITQKFTTDAGSIVQNIMQNIVGTKKPVVIGDPVKGVQDLLVSRLTPLQAIDMVRRRSVSSQYASSTYCFFENKRGFNFASLEYLMDNQKHNINDKVFYYDPAAQTDAKNMNSRNIINFINISNVNNTTKLTSGALHNTVKKFDILTGTVSEFNYVNAEQQSKFKFGANTAAPLNTGTFEQEYGQTNASTMLAPHDSSLPDTFISDSLGAKTAYVNKVSQHKYLVHVNGDPALTAGDIITINVPTATGADSQDDNRLISGNYLISKIRHIILLNTTEPKSYTCSMELVRGWFNEAP